MTPSRSYRANPVTKPARSRSLEQNGAAGRNRIELSVLLPCRNEERTVGNCIDAALIALRHNGIRGEVIVADNGSSDRSGSIARKRGARVIRVESPGYGEALRAGIEAARGQYVIIADADESYDLSGLMTFVDQLRQGYDLVMGNRFRGGIEKGAMPWHHQFIGNPVLSILGRLTCRTPARDFHCGMRGFRRVAALHMNLQSSGMEFATEMVVKASLLSLRVCEVPIRLYPDRRGRPPHLRSFSDGWRHLRFLLLYSPTWLFGYPGAALLLVGGILSIVLLAGPVDLGTRRVDFHSLFLASTIMVIGFNMLAFFAITRVYAYNTRLLPARPGIFSLLRFLNLERGLLVGTAIFLVGVAVLVYAALLSETPGFAALGFHRSIRWVYTGSITLIIGGQIILASFVLSLLGLNPRA